MIRPFLYALLCALCLGANAQTAAIGDLHPSQSVVTNELDAPALAALSGTNAILNAAITNEAAYRIAGDAAEAALRVAGTNVLHAAVTNEAALRAAAIAAEAALRSAGTNALHAAVTNEAALRIAGTNALHTALANALTNEQDLAALRLHHYGSPDIVENPAEWFTFADGVITGFNWEDGRTNVVIPWAIVGVAVTNVGALAFYDSDMLNGYPVVSVTAPQTLKTIGSGAFRSCSSLASVSFPQVTTIGDQALGGCTSLASVSLGQDAPDEATDVLANSPATVYVTNPQATGWGETWNGRPVVRPAVYSAAPAWIAITNLASQTTVITNAAEAPVTLYATGSVEVAFSALRPPLPLYLVVAGPSSLTFPAGTRFIGGGSWQTNRANHFIVWMTGTNLFVNPVTATED